MFKKSIVVGVSVHPEAGLEVAQVDFANKVVLKYGSRELGYDSARREITDLDIFKENLKDLFMELQIPKGSEVVLNLPTVLFRVTDYPASLSGEEIENIIQEELMNHPIFQNNEGAVGAVKLPNSTIQFSKIAYTVSQKIQLIEIALAIYEMGYKIVGIDTSVNSTLNALIYNSRINTAPDASWVMLLVDNNCCRILPMQGRNYVDCFEEKIGIGEVLGDAENYATVVNAIQPILKNIPSQCLYVVSRTNLISAEVLASKLTYNGQIVHQEANSYTKTPFIEVAPTVDEELASKISLDVIGAAINRDFADVSTANINLYNESLGDVYTANQPLVLKFGGLSIVASLENMLTLCILLIVIAAVIIFSALAPINSEITNKQSTIADLDRQISDIERKLKENSDISTDLFDEGDEIRMGLMHNKSIYTYYTIVGTEIPTKLWLTSLKLGNQTVIEGQADNLESIYGFFRNIKDYDPSSGIKLQKLGLASSRKLTPIEDGSEEEQTYNTDSLITSLEADYYEFCISDGAAPVSIPSTPASSSDLPDLESLN